MSLRQSLIRILGGADARASLENPSTSLSNPAAWLSQWVGGMPSKAGISVNEESATRLTAVYGCVRVLSGLIGMLPVSLYERVGSSRQMATDHPMQSLLHVRPNDEQTPYFFHQTITAHALLWGNGYAGIVRGENRRPVELLPLLPGRTWADRRAGQLMYHTLVDGGEIQITPADVVHIPALGFDGISGRSPITMAREAFALGIAAEEFGASFFGRGGHLSGVLEHPLKLGDTAAKHLRESWESMHSGIDNSHKVAILEEGMKYAKIGVPPEDAQFLETRKFQIQEICRMFGVPPHLVADLERATFSNIEQQDLDLVRHTLMPWLVRYEQEYNRKLLRPAEQGRFFFKFNLEALLRGDSAARSQFYREMFNIGALSQNDIRGKEDMNPIDGGDRYFVPLNMVPVDRVDDVAEDAPAPTDEAARARIISAHLPVFEQAAGVVLRREAQGLAKCVRELEVENAPEFANNMRRLYETLPRTIATAFDAPVRSLLTCLGVFGDAVVAAHLRDIGARYVSAARAELYALPQDALAMRLKVAAWSDEKAERVARDELDKAAALAASKREIAA